MEDNRQLAGDRNRGLLAADLLDQPSALGFERLLPEDTVQDHPTGLEQVGAHQRIAAAGDAPATVHLARQIVPRGQAEIGADVAGFRKSSRIIDDAGRSTLPRSDAGRRH